jgi:hypothetical protein
MPLTGASTAARCGGPGEGIFAKGHRARRFSPALISSYTAIARSNFSVNSHMASRMSRYVALSRARSALPKVKI